MVGVGCAAKGGLDGATGLVTGGFGGFVVAGGACTVKGGVDGTAGLAAGGFG
ncbi:MAG TPA: hypothetical protein VLZ81_03805 [Blastocatellia bacterium]|nr:hypothetical protein [Blastocatellia bacterium]